VWSVADLLTAVDTVFGAVAQHLAPWPDPHQGRPPRDDEYSRVTDAGRYRLVGARADAWIAVLTDRGLASVHHDVEWRQPPRTLVTRAARLEPTAPNALALVIARSAIADIDDAGVTLAVGRPAAFVEGFPDCGCDACDSGSQDVLDHLDRHILAVVQGRFRRFFQSDRHLTVLGDGGWSAHNLSTAQALAVLADPTGWSEISGTPWGWPSDP
jgi:hypothetical protein